MGSHALEKLQRKIRPDLVERVRLHPSRRCNERGDLREEGLGRIDRHEHGIKPMLIDEALGRIAGKALRSHGQHRDVEAGKQGGPVREAETGFGVAAEPRPLKVGLLCHSDRSVAVVDPEKDAEVVQVFAGYRQLLDVLEKTAITFHQEHAPIRVRQRHADRAGEAVAHRRLALVAEHQRSGRQRDGLIRGCE